LIRAHTLDYNYPMGIHQELIRLMEEDTARTVMVGPHLTAVRSGKRCGFASTQYGGEKPHTAPSVRSAGELAGRSLAELSALVFSDRPMEAGIGMAAINAGLPLEGLDLCERNGFDLLKHKAAGKSLVMVGRFRFERNATKAAAKCTVLELDPVQGDLPASEASRVIPRAEVVAITGSAFANRTIEDLLNLSRDKWVMVIGPSTPVTPLLFDYGVDAVAGAIVTDVELALRCVAEGSIFKQLKGVRRVLLEK